MCRTPNDHGTSVPAAASVCHSSELTLDNSPMLGSLHTPVDNPHAPLVVCIGGSDRGASRFVARALSTRGFSAAAIEYYGRPGLPPHLAQIHLEYFITAIEWLRERCRPIGDCVAIRGHSRGAQSSLILAALGVRVTSIVAYVPSARIGWTTDDETGARLPTWLFRGEPVDLHFGGRFGDSDHIPVERITCPLLLVSAKDDRQWPSYDACLHIVERLTFSEFPHRCEHVAYENAGHGISYPPPFGLWLAAGGTEEGNRLATAAAWECSLKFIGDECRRV